MKFILIYSSLFFIVTTAYCQDEKQKAAEQQIIKLSGDWMKATMNRDEAALNRIVAPEFKLGGTDLSSPPLPRAIWMKNTLENLKIDSVNYLQSKVYVVGDVAIMQSVFYWSVVFREMPKKTDTLKLVDTWIKRDGDWQVVSRLLVD